MASDLGASYWAVVADQWASNLKAYQAAVVVDRRASFQVVAVTAQETSLEGIAAAAATVVQGK